MGTNLAIEAKKINPLLTKEVIEEKLKSNDFIKNTHIPNHMHKQQKLSSRINFIRDILAEGI